MPSTPSTTTKFLIAALPRSGTLWLANYLCANGLPTVHEYSVSGGYEGWAGACGSDCIDHHDQLINELPEAKWVIIERSREDAEASFRRVFPNLDGGEVAQYFRTRQEKLASIQGFRVPFKGLFKLRQLRRIAEHLGFEHNEKLAIQFIQSKIELHPEHLESWESQQH